MVDNYEALMKELGLHKALMAIWEVIGKVNKYIDMMTPWVLAESDRERLASVMFHIIEALKIISALIWPFMPQSAEKIQEQLSLPKRGKEVNLNDVRSWGEQKPMGAVTRAPALFPRIDVKGKKKGPKESEGRKTENKMEKISLKEFQKVDLRVGTIKEVERITGSKKLLKLRVDIGEERTVVAGLSGYYAEEDLNGKQILLVANLEPVKLMGVESYGMVLATEDASGLHLLIPDSPAVPGSKAK